MTDLNRDVDRGRPGPPAADLIEIIDVLSRQLDEIAERAGCGAYTEMPDRLVDLADRCYTNRYDPG